MTWSHTIIKVVCAVGLPLATIFACSSSTDSSSNLFAPSVSGCTPTTDSVQKTLFAPKCATAGCHAGATPQADLDLGSPGVDARLVGVAATQCAGKTLVVAGNASASYLVDKLGTKPSCGASMPSGGPVLDPSDVACISNWIAMIKPGSVDGGGSSSGGPDAGNACNAGYTSCNSVCVDTKSDPMNCGTCGNTCPVACSNGACVTACPDPTSNCSGACVDLKTNNDHCGDCATSCTTQGKTCTNGSCSCGATVSTLADVQGQIFTPSCATSNCHAPTKVGMKTLAPQAGLDLTAASARANLVGVASSTCSGRTRVVAGNVSSSYLVNKLTGVGMCSGSEMPKGAKLAAGKVDMVKSWICNGAQ